MSSFDLGLILRIFTSPNLAFSQIRDNEEKFFAQSIGLLIVSSALGALVMLPFVMMPLDERYFEDISGEEMFDTGFPMDESDVVISVGLGIFNGFVAAVLFFFIGKKLDGNKNWKKVFSVILHTHAIAIPMVIILSIVIFLMWDSFTSIDPSFLLNPQADEEEIFLKLGSFLGYVALLAILGIGFFVWIFVVTIKAVKIVHGFDTGKAFGLVILVMIITSIVSIPFGL